MQDPDWIEMQREWDGLFAVRLPPIRIKDKAGEMSPSTAAQRIRRMQTESSVSSHQSPKESPMSKSKSMAPDSGTQTPARTNPVYHSSSLMVVPGESKLHHVDPPERSVRFNST